MLSNTSACRFTYLTPVQERSLPLTLQGKDLAVQAQTGSGKTAVFLVTIFNHLLRNPRPEKKGSNPRALVITPCHYPCSHWFRRRPR